MKVLKQLMTKIKSKMATNKDNDQSQVTRTNRYIHHFSRIVRRNDIPVDFVLKIDIKLLMIRCLVETTNIFLAKHPWPREPGR